VSPWPAHLLAGFRWINSLAREIRPCSGNGKRYAIENSSLEHVCCARGRGLVYLICAAQ